MKAKEYFEKYFADIEASDENPNNEVFLRRAGKLVQDLTNEALELCDARHSHSNSTVDGVLKEQNQKFNSIANMIEKKYGHAYLKRNGLILYWQDQLNKGTKGGAEK